MALLPLTNDAVALIDDADEPLVLGRKWHLIKEPGGGLYAGTNIGKKGHQRKLRLHTLLMKPARGLEVDHINGDGLDNRRENLRVVTRAQNQHNQHRVYGRSAFKGVSPQDGRWAAQIRVNGKSKALGRFATEREAALAYDAAAIAHRGEYAATNQSLGLLDFPPSGGTT